MLMTLLLLIFYSILSLRKALAYGDVLHPLVGYTLPFLVQYIVYLVFYESYYPVSHNTLIIYTGSITIFVMFYCLFENIFSFYIGNQKIKTVVVETGLLKLIAAVTIATKMMEIGSSVLSMGLNGAYRYMRYEVNYGDGKSFLSKYLPVLYNTAFISWVTELIRKKEIKKEKINVIIYAILFFVIAFFSFARTSLVMALCAFGYCMLQNNKTTSLNAKNKISRIVFIGVSFALLFYLFSWIAESTNKMGNIDFMSSEYFVWKYLGFPLVTMDKYATINPGATCGHYFLGIVGELSRKLELLAEGDLSILPIKGEFNVFSYIGCVYLDFGVGCFVVQLFIAMFVAYIYIKNKKNGGKWTVFYAFYLYAIFLSFYSYQYSLTLYVYIFILLSLVERKLNFQIKRN